MKYNYKVIEHHEEEKEEKEEYELTEKVKQDHHKINNRYQVVQDQVQEQQEDQEQIIDQQEEQEQIIDQQEEQEHDEWSSAVVPTTDNPEISSFTWRVLVIGLIWSTFLSISNTIFSFRNNPFSIPSTIAVLLSFPMVHFNYIIITCNNNNNTTYNTKHTIIIQYIIQNIL